MRFIKLILSICLVGIILLFNGNKVNAAGDLSSNIIRLGGLDRYDTSSKILQTGWKNSTDYAVLATGADFPDALSAAPLAKEYNAPIILTDKDGLTASIIQSLGNLHVKHIFIIGGTGVITQKIEDNLHNLGYETERIAGINRYETSLKIANKIGNYKQIVLATGVDFPDALSIAPIAAERGMPIILTEKNSLPNETKQFLVDKNIETTYIVGGTGVINDYVSKQVPNAVRLSGANRYETNYTIINTFLNNELDLSNVFIATGKDFPDALSGSALAALNKSPIFLIDEGYTQYAYSIIKLNTNLIKNKYVLGGEGAVSTKSVNLLFNDQVLSSADQLKQYLANNYSTLDTAIGQTSFTYTISENHDISFAYDYWIQVNFNLDFFWNKLNDNRFTSDQRSLARQQLMNFQEKLARDVISKMPTKKLYGGYYTSWYRYPYIKEGFESRKYYSWKNFDNDPFGTTSDLYDNTKVTDFMWWDFIDNQL